ncbi:hypothetical protein DFH07DRAFT_969173 [Mycena maculata]|uniref:Acetyl-CoA synthetase-like protein n=1 Tax=Mycena maculata TaxID=230809 RepID=A0AAD7HXJ4_9AGAR|nr:hypothetical protein DFH07DRAFT_969173 [Mycena maculata]
MQTQFPTPQGLLSSTFEQPPLDGSLLLPEIFDHHAQRSPNHPLFHYVDADGVVGTIVWLQAVQGFHNAAHIIRRYVNVESPERRPVVGVVASSDQITYFSVIAGILRAGYQAFPVSPRNSDVGISHLLQSTDCTHVFVSPDSATQKLVAAAAAKLSGLGKEINILPIPTFEDLFASDSPEFMPPMRKIGLDAPAVILHSSGSTAFPKTITFTYRILMESGLIPYYGRIDLCGHVLSAHAVPMFHLMGVIQLPWTTFCGLTISVLPPTSPPIVPTPDRVFDGAIATKSSLLFCVPAFLESWAREPHRLAALKSFRTVIFGGGPLQPAVGDMLVQHGVHIAHVYGLTETSNLTWFLPESAPKEGWDYFYLSPHTDPVFVPLEDIPGVYHLVIKKSPIHTPAMLDTVVDGVPGLNTNDLFVQHPTNPNLWKVYGRHDDQIMHSTGEKTNPGPLGKFHAGVLVFPAEPIDPADAQQVIEFRRQIWSTVEEANQLAPTHSRLFKEMILVADPSRPIELTAKGTPRRQAVLNIYQDEIRDMYGAVEESSQTHLTAPEEYDFPATLQFMRHVVSEVMLEMPGDDDDIFQHGCDSLQATWIRNSIFHAFRKSQRVDMKTIPSNFVYSYPTLRLLADLFTQLASGSGSKPENVSLRADAMQAMAHKYTQGFPAHRASAEKPEDEVLLVTGTTGALGSHLIAHLLDLPEVSMVYALNRPSSKSTKSIQERQRSSFVANGIDVHLLESPKLKLFEANLSLPRLGLSNEDHGSLRATVTSIVHNAWQVNFNISLSTLEPLVAGTRHLVDFALSSPHPLPPRFIFISTAGIFRNSTGTVAPEEHVAGPKIAVGLGYTESKWVAEEILETAAQRTALSPVVIRPGQLSGAANGAWNASDWFPALLKSSQLLGHLPALSGRASWFPIHHAARVVAHLRTSSDHYLHITHPQPIPTSDITSALSHALGLPLVPYAEWLESLEAASLQESAAASNPGVRLLDFFRAYREVGPKQDMFSPAGLANERATRAAGWMLDVAPLAASDVDAWVSHLRQVRYLD